MPHDLSGWGVTGWSTEWAVLDSSDDDLAGGGYGIVKVVDPGVVYCSPPFIDGVPGWGEVAGGRGRSFTMPWSEDAAPRYRALTDFHGTLAPRRSELQKEDEELRVLDDAVMELVQVAARLHKSGGTLGYLQPHSVLVCHGRDGKAKVVLPDLGFFWDDERGLREPKWIADPELELVFENGARRRNSECLKACRQDASAMELGKKAAGQAARQAEDVRLLARMIAVTLAGTEAVRGWCGQGRALLSVPGRDKAPDTQAPIWDRVIAPALLGQIETCDALASRLESARPSEHFLFKPPAPPPLWKKALRQAAPAMAGLVVILGLSAAAPFLYRLLFPPCKPHALCKQVCAASPLYARLDEVENVRGAALAGVDPAAVAAYWQSLVTLSDLPEPCRGSLRGECAGLAEKVGGESIESLRRRPRPRSQELELLRQAIALVQAVQADLPGGASRVSGLLEKQVRLRGRAATGKPDVRPLESRPEPQLR
jgi:hypothetical protein